MHGSILGNLGVGGDTSSNLLNNLTQFELPSTRMSTDTQTPAGDGAYAVPLGLPLAHAQSLAGFASRAGGGWKNPSTDAHSIHMFLLIGGAVVGLVVLRRVFKGAII